MTIRRSRLVAGALLFYSLLALATTWPLAAHFASHVPGDGIDDPALVWNLWWMKARLVDQLQPDFFHVGWMFHPVGINLAFYTLTPLNGLLSIPLQSAFGLIVANNLILLSSYVLGAFGAFLLALDQLPGARWALNGPADNAARPIPSPASKALLRFLPALFAGAIYAFAAPKLFYASLGQFNIASSQWIPFCVLFALRMTRCTTWRPLLRNALLAGLFLTLQAWAELTFASFLLIFVAFLFIWRLGALLRAQQRWRAGLTTVLAFCVLGLLFMAGVSPFLWAMAPDLRREGDFFASGGGFADIFSADMAGYLLPTRLHPLFGAWVGSLPFPNDKAQQIFLGYSVMALAALGAVRLVQSRTASLRAAGWFWSVSAGLFTLLTLGPHLRWLGRDLPIPGPFALVSLLPVFNGNRYPSRYGVMLLLGVAVLAAAGLSTLLQWVAQGRDNQRRPSAAALVAISALCLLLFLFEHLSIPLPLNDFSIPPIYRELANQPGDFAVLELPTGWRNGARLLGRSDVLIMMQQWYQTAHGKRRLGGNTSRNPPDKFQYFTDAPLLGDLIALMNADRDYMQPVVDAQLEAMIARNRAIAPAVLSDLGVRFVVVTVERATPQLLRFVDAALPLELQREWSGSDWTGAASTIRLYRVVDDARREFNADLTGPAAALYLAEGWSTQAAAVRYAARPTADLLLPLPDRTSELRLAVTGPATGVTVQVNGEDAGNFAVGPGDDATALVIPIAAGQAAQLVDRVSLHFSGGERRGAESATPPTAQGWPIGATGAWLAGSANLVVISAGEDAGDFAHILVNGVDAAANSRGYNLVALQSDGAVLGSAAFDTLADEGQSTALTAWVAQWPVGTIIAGAVRDEASFRLTEQAVTALASLGVFTDLRGKFRWGHAFVGAVGAPSHTAIDNARLLQPATTVIGAPVDGVTIFGGIVSVQITTPTNQNVGQ